MALADIHYGFETNRRRRGELLPEWGMAATEAQLVALIEEHEPETLILVGDIMDGGGSVNETLALLERLGGLVERLVCLRGNHDRVGLRRSVEFCPWHREGAFVFHHGDRFEKVHGETDEPGCIHVVGHEHPAVRLTDGAGMRLKLPALVRERLDGESERWVLPAFSLWAAGGEYRSTCERIETWICAPGRVFSL